jgi:glycosyltransferase involved in cell wall biosynthesis
MADVPPNPDSGAAGTEFQTVQALLRQGHVVDCIWAGDMPRRIAHGNLHYLLELPANYRRAMERRLSEGPRYDVVHANQPHGYAAARRLRSMGPGRPVFIHRSHGFEPRIRDAVRRWPDPLDTAPLLRRAARGVMESLLERNYRGIARWADGHIVSSSLCARDIAHRYGVEPWRIECVPQAAPDGYLAAPAAPLDGRLQRLLHVGQFSFFKGPHVLAQAVRQILDTHAGATFTWVCAAEHHAMARHLFPAALQARVNLLDWLPQERLRDVYDAHGILLFPSLAEGFGKVFLEGMARGLVVIASDEGGARDLIEPGVNGWRVAVADARGLAQRCEDTLRAPHEAQAMARRARATAVGITWDEVARRTAAFYQRISERLA